MSANFYLNPEERKILESAVVGIAGAGGLGSNCAMHLVRSGVKHLVLADFDTVSESNLNRQFFFRDQLGMAKIEALAANLRRIEPDLQLDLHNARLTSGNLPSVFGNCAIVVEAFDCAEVKTMLLSTLRSTGKMLVSASGIAGWGRSGEIKLRRVGTNLVLIGDCASGVGGEAGLSPFSPRVGIAAAMEANTVIALLLNQPL